MQAHLAQYYKKRIMCNKEVHNYEIKKRNIFGTNKTVL